MKALTVILTTPLKIDVAHIAKFYPEFRYRAPYDAEGFIPANTSEYIMNDGDLDNFGFLMFDDKNEDGFKSITSYYTPEELAGLFTRLPQEYSSQLISAFKGTSLEIPELRENACKKINDIFTTQQAGIQKLMVLKAPLKNSKMVDFKSSEAVTVLMREYAVTNADSDQPILGTYGAGPCVILALYDQQNKKAVLTHISVMTNLRSLAKLFAEITFENTVAHLAGGNSQTQDMCIEIIELLQSKGMKIENADLVKRPSEPASLAIDARTGAIYSPVRYHQLNQTPDIRMRIEIESLQFKQMPIRQCYNSLQSKGATQQTYSSIGLAQSSEIPNKRSAHSITLGFKSTTEDSKKKPMTQQNFCECEMESGFLNSK